MNSEHTETGTESTNNQPTGHSKVDSDPAHNLKKRKNKTKKKKTDTNSLLTGGEVTTEGLLFSNPLTPARKCILTEHDFIVEAFHLKFKREEGKKWLLKEEDWVDVVAAVNQ